MTRIPAAALASAILASGAACGATIPADPATAFRERHGVGGRSRGGGRRHHGARPGRLAVLRPRIAPRVARGVLGLACRRGEPRAPGGGGRSLAGGRRTWKALSRPWSTPGPWGRYSTRWPYATAITWWRSTDISCRSWSPRTWPATTAISSAPRYAIELSRRRTGVASSACFLIKSSSGRWYEVRDPALVGSRGQLRTFRPVYLYIVARRIADGLVFAVPPQQSDYVSRRNDEPPTRRPAGAGLHIPSSGTSDALSRALRSLLHLVQATVLPFDRRSFTRVAISELKPREEHDAT